MSLLYSSEILGELDRASEEIDERKVLELAELLQKADRIFLDGLGRSGLCCQAFAMRLMHLGLESFMVGDIITPSIRQGDLLVICTGSGESQSLLAHAKTAKEQGARLAVITTNPDSPAGRMSDLCLRICAPKKDEEGDGSRSILPMGSLFEGTASLLFENLVLLLMHSMKESSESMFARHANLE